MNKGLRALEDRLGAWYARLPALPLRVRRTITENVWWVVLVIALVGTVVLLYDIPRIVGLTNYSRYSSIYMYTSADIAAAIANSIIIFVLGIIAIGLLYAAVGPLKERTRRGWQLLFLAELFSILATIISFIVTIQGASIFGFLFQLAVAAAELYLLFAIKPDFEGRWARARTAKVVEPKD